MEPTNNFNNKNFNEYSDETKTNQKQQKQLKKFSNLIMAGNKEILKNIFYRLLVRNRNNGSENLFFIPFSQLPEPMKTKQIETTNVDILELFEASLEIQEREKIWKKRYPDKNIYIVKTLQPLKIHGTSRRDITKICMVSSLDEMLNNTDENEIKPVVKKCQRTASKLEITPKKKNKYFIQKDLENYLDPSSESEDLIHVNVMRIIDKLKIQFSESINKFGSDLYPDESMLLIWDSLSQLIVQKLALDPESERKCLEACLKYWENIHFSIVMLFLAYINKDNSKMDFNLDLAIKKLKNCQTFFKNQLKELGDTLGTAINEMQLPLIHCLEQGKKTSVPKEIFAKKFYEFLYEQTLGNWSYRTVYINPTKNASKNWLQKRAELLEIYLREIQSSEPKPNDEFCNEIDLLLKALKENNWLDAHHFISTKMKTLFTKFTNLSGTIEIPLDLAQFKDYKKIRCLQYANAFLKDLENITLNSDLYDAVSEVVCKELEDSYKAFRLPLTSKKTRIPEFSEWINANKEKYPEIFTTTDEFKTVWKKLKKIKESLNENQEFIKAFETLFESIAKKDFSDFMNLCSNVSKHFEPQIKSWIDELNQINKCIQKSQDLFILMLANPELKSIDISKLKQQFQLYNNHLCELIIPMTRLLNAFKQLNHLDQKPKSLRKQSDIEQARFTSESETFKLSLFVTDKKYFKSLADTLKKVHEQSKSQENLLLIEVEEEENSQGKDQEFIHQANLAPKNVEIESEVKKIFNENKKSRKILKNLKQLMNDYQIDYKTKFGKGDHNKLYLNGVPIVLPEHKEWKPGTLKSIQKDVIQKMQEALAKRIAQSE